MLTFYNIYDVEKDSLHKLYGYDTERLNFGSGKNAKISMSEECFNRWFTSDMKEPSVKFILKENGANIGDCLITVWQEFNSFEFAFSIVLEENTSTFKNLCHWCKVDHGFKFDPLKRKLVRFTDNERRLWKMKGMSE